MSTSGSRRSTPGDAHLLIRRLSDDVTFQEYDAAADEDPAMFTDVYGNGTVHPGGAVLLTADLEPGNWIVDNIYIPEGADEPEFAGDRFVVVESDNDASAPRRGWRRRARTRHERGRTASRSRPPASGSSRITMTPRCTRPPSSDWPTARPRRTRSRGSPTSRVHRRSPATSAAWAHWVQATRPGSRSRRRARTRPLLVDVLDPEPVHVHPARDERHVRRVRRRGIVMRHSPSAEPNSRHRRSTHHETKDTPDAGRCWPA